MFHGKLFNSFVDFLLIWRYHIVGLLYYKYSYVNIVFRLWGVQFSTWWTLVQLAFHCNDGHLVECDMWKLNDCVLLCLIITTITQLSSPFWTIKHFIHSKCTSWILLFIKRRNKGFGFVKKRNKKRANISFKAILWSNLQLQDWLTILAADDC